MFTAEQAKDLANEYNGILNLHGILREIRKRAKRGLYFYIILIKDFNRYICSIEDIQQLGYKTEILFDKIYEKDYLYITWD